MAGSSREVIGMSVEILVSFTVVLEGARLPLGRHVTERQSMAKVGNNLKDPQLVIEASDPGL